MYLQILFQLSLKLPIQLPRVTVSAITDTVTVTVKTTEAVTYPMSGLMNFHSFNFSPPILVVHRGSGVDKAPEAVKLAVGGAVVKGQPTNTKRIRFMI